MITGLSEAEAIHVIKKAHNVGDVEAKFIYLIDQHKIDGDTIDTSTAEGKRAAKLLDEEAADK